MPIKEIYTYTVQLKCGRDDRSIAFMEQPHVTNAEALRLGLEMYIDSLEKKQTFEADALAALERIEGAIGHAPGNEGGRVTESVTPGPKSDNPFLNASP